MRRFYYQFFDFGNQAALALKKDDPTGVNLPPDYDNEFTPAPIVPMPQALSYRERDQLMIDFITAANALLAQE